MIFSYNACYNIIFSIAINLTNKSVAGKIHDKNKYTLTEVRPEAFGNHNGRLKNGTKFFYSSSFL